MAKAKLKSNIPPASYEFLKNYINNASPVGFETWGQKLWIDYIKPFVDDHYVDPYGTAVAIVNPEHPFKVVIEAHAEEVLRYKDIKDACDDMERWERRSED